jgi:hypothetical protein
MKKILLSVSLLLLTEQFSKAQITITDSVGFSSIASLLQGFGTNITNTVYNCDSASVAQFSGVSELPNTNGLLLSTGFADSVANPSSTFCSGVMTSGVTNDLDMNALAGFLPTYDGCILEFDCVPLGDTLLFNYTFASEEYPEFVGLGFNDAFGIFLTGPGYNNVNIANIPGTNTPVTVNNINANVNSGFYYDNTQGQNCGFDGFSLSLTSTTAVTPNQTYHFKIGVADASDQIFDTGVFLEAFSFRSNLSTGFSSLENGNNISLVNDFPNSRVSFKFRQLSGENTFLQVFDLNGKTVITQKIPVGVLNYEVSLENLSPGIYLARLSGEKLTSRSFKLIKN